MFPLLETILELTFRDGLEYARRIIFNRRFVIESLSFEWFLSFGNSQKSQGLCSDSTEVVEAMRYCVYSETAAQDSMNALAHTRVIPKILFKISQTVVFGIPRSFSTSRTVNRRSPSIASRTRSILYNVFFVEAQPERE